MAKPAIALSVPPLLFTGREHVLEIQITPEEAIKVDHVSARLIGKQGWEVGSGKSRRSHRVIYPQLESRLMERGVLPAEPTRFRMPFALPHDMPATHEVEPAYAFLELQIQIGIPWWFDTRYRYYLPVRMPAPPFVQRTPYAMRSTPPDAPADKPRIEISLASTRVVIGETVHGSLAAFHFDDSKPREVDLQLVPHLQLYGNGTRDRTGGGYNWKVTIPAGQAGQAIPFALAVPMKATPSLITATHRLGWALHASTGSLFGSKASLSMPLELVDASALTTTPQATVAPRLADERVGAVFARFAGTRGWLGHRLDAADDDDARVAIEREVGASTLRLTYAYREDGTFLVSRVASRSLGLGLSVTPSSALRHVFWKDIEVDIAAWDRDHHVTARFADQTKPALEAVVPTLMRLPALGTLVRWTDDTIVFERAVPTVEEPDLVACEGALEAVAAVLDVARTAVKPPPGLPVELAGFLELARTLGGELVLGDLSIHGKLGHVPVELGLQFDGEDDHRPVAFLVTAGEPNDASAAARAVSLELPRPAADVLGANVAESLVDPLTRWPTDFVDLRVHDGVASARWQLGAAADAARVRELVHAIVAVLAALDPGAGPYR